MLAVIRLGGKQYKVKKDSILSVDKLQLQEGSESNVLRIKDIVMIHDDSNPQESGPTYCTQEEVKNYYVDIQVLKNFRSPKIIVFKKKKRKNYRRKHGHKQMMCSVKILDISCEK